MTDDAVVPDDEFEADAAPLSDAEADAIVGTVDAEHPIVLTEVDAPIPTDIGHDQQLAEEDLVGVDVES